MMSSHAALPVFASAERHRERIAIVAQDGTFDYAALLELSERVASGLLGDGPDLNGARVAFMLPPSAAYVATLWGIWRAGGVAVPLCITHPAPELEHTLRDCGAAQLIAHADYTALLSPHAHAVRCPLHSSLELTQHEKTRLPALAPERPALLIYTSGTTGKPKGALSTHAILEAQMQSIVQAWELREHDRILHVLPLHHLHGILNALCAPLLAGGACEITPRFDAERVFERIAESHELSLFMAVPTIYAKLAAVYDAAPKHARRAFRSGCERLRLLVSGSAALPISTLERMREITGHTLLERYGMTEIGMGLGQPLHGERRPGSVGVAFPGVEARIVDDADRELGDDQVGALQIRGPNVFAGYHGKPDATRAAFTSDGFFRTGDVAVRERGQYRLLGRSSVDIVKTGGFKVSALEIEETLREHPAIAEVCVVGVPDDEWGECVAAAVELRAGSTLELAELRAWGKQRLAPYKVPSRLRVLAELPRNALGKVKKPEIQQLWAAGSPPATRRFQP
jgi:malonyl-CoA/methylmalonyl-CoA synthetase